MNNDDIMRKVQEQGRMTTEEHRRLFEKKDSTQWMRENLQEGREKLKGRLDKQSREVDRKLSETLNKMKPSYVTEVNQAEARHRDRVVSERLKSEIKKGNIPQFRPDASAVRWMKKARGL